jgi:hypothetical protein
MSLPLCYDAPNVISAEVQIGISTDEKEEVVLRLLSGRKVKERTIHKFPS